MRIISWNVNGIRACAKKGFVDFMERTDPAVLCLQETKARPEQLDETLLKPPSRKAYWSSASKAGYSGTATYVKEDPKGVSYGIGIEKFDIEGRFVITEHKDFSLYNVYFPNGAASEERHHFKQEFLAEFTKHLVRRLAKGDSLIVVGDYNVAHLDIDVFDPKRLSTVSGFLPEERKWFGEFLNAGFIDTFRFLHPDLKEQYTWWSYRENARISNRGWRIDHICVSQSLKSRIKRVEILDQQLGSDHCPILIELADH